ncbi:NAD-dependent epimerase/dehydratase family protein [Sphingobacterium puteale]|uniref:NAD-dependent epimerase/dehydratase family protein n=1 Tax=Sphingobacterium puteale TaxID=2420510 RepID=UPI003D988D53
MIGIVGSSGFIGTFLSNSLEGTVGISMRNENWQDELKNKNIIINLVGKAHDHEGNSTKKDYEHINVDLTKELFKVFIKSEACLFIHVSSIAAIEEFESEDIITEQSLCNPQSWYGKSKLEADNWLMKQTLPDHKKMIILRPPMVHGPGDKGNLQLLFRLISKGIPNPLASFDNKRSFISIYNFTFFIEQVIGKKDQIISGLYNIADDESISTREIIDEIKRISGRKGINLYVPRFLIKTIAKLGDIIPLPLNSNRFRKMTGNLIVSNSKIKKMLELESIPLSAKQGLIKTLLSLDNTYRKTKTNL